ncbi:MAG: formyltransferase family protein [Burkholderiales bacterium]
MSHQPMYLYVGNRSAVLRRMVDIGLNIRGVLCPQGSWLERDALQFALPFASFGSKAQALRLIEESRFDVLVSCGCPYILPISALRKSFPNAKFINLHPSFLPDLRGADPIRGAILYRRNSGVTCHHMDDGIDTGSIISQLPIKYFDGMDAKLLYSMCFKLEPVVFEQALGRNFAAAAQAPREISDGALYFSARSADARFNQADSCEDTVARLRAFNTQGRGLEFVAKGVCYRAFEGDVLEEASALGKFGSAAEGEIVAVFDGQIFVRHRNSVMRLAQISPTPGSHLLGSTIGP